MCSNTKDKIAAVLRQIVLERPLSKITVQNLMDAANMKRQSFYYHFKDIQDVVVWIIERDILTPLCKLDLPFDQWIIHGFKLLDENKAFYKKTVSLVRTDFIFQKSRETLCPRIADFLYGTNHPEHLDEQKQFVVNFFAKAILGHASEFAKSRQAFDEKLALAYIHSIFEIINHPTKDPMASNTYLIESLPV